MGLVIDDGVFYKRCINSINLVCQQNPPTPARHACQWYRSTICCLVLNVILYSTILCLVINGFVNQAGEIDQEFLDRQVGDRGKNFLEVETESSISEYFNC